MELLAPAGNLDNFYAAMEAGADAVYVGAPGINARNLSRDLSFAEIGAMIDYAHEHG
jgi:putative protease